MVLPTAHPGVRIHPSTIHLTLVVLKDRSPVYFGFLNSFDPFGCFAARITQLQKVFGGDIQLIWGECDGLVPHHMAKRWCDMLPQATLHTVPGAGHNVPLSQPEALEKLLLPILRGSLGKGGFPDYSLYTESFALLAQEDID